MKKRGQNQVRTNSLSVFKYVFPLNAIDNSNQSLNQTRCGRNPLVGVETQFKLLNLKTGFVEEAKSGWERR